MSHFSPVYILHTHSVNVHFNIILLAVFKSPNWCLYVKLIVSPFGGQEARIRGRNFVIRDFLCKAGNSSPDQETPSFCGTQEFVTVVTKSCRWSPSWASSVHFTSSQYNFHCLYAISSCHQWLLSTFCWHHLHWDDPHKGKWSLLSSVPLSKVSVGSERIMRR
jgi:hypothetical protein